MLVAPTASLENMPVEVNAEVSGQRALLDTEIAISGIGRARAAALQADDLPKVANGYYRCSESSKYISQLGITLRDAKHQRTVFHVVPTGSGKNALRRANSLDLFSWGSIWDIGKSVFVPSSLNPGTAFRNLSSAVIIELYKNNKDTLAELKREFIICRDHYTTFGRIDALIAEVQRAYPHLLSELEPLKFSIRSWTGIYQQLYCHMLGTTINNSFGGPTWDLEGYRTANYNLIDWLLDLCNW